MALIHFTAPALPEIPDNITVPQFFLDDTSTSTVFRHPPRSPQIPSLIEEDTGRRVYYEEIGRRTEALANALKARYDFRDREIVMLFSPNHIDYPVCVWAVLRLGGIVACSNPFLTPDEMAYHIELTSPTLIITHITCLPNVLKATKNTPTLQHSRIIVIDENKLPDGSPFQSLDRLVMDHINTPRRAYTEIKLSPGEGKSRIAFLCFSSGTSSGKSKAVAVSHYNTICNVIQIVTMNRMNDPDYHRDAPWEERRFRQGDVGMGSVPFYHIYGLIFNMHFMIYTGITVVVSQSFVFEKFLNSIAQYRITHLTLVPPQVVLLCKHEAVLKYDLSSVRCCMVAAAPVSAELTRQLLQRMPNIHLGQGYGLTESTGGVAAFPLSQKVGTAGSAGQLLPGTTAKVVKADGTLADIGEVGEMWIKGGQIALGYYKNEEATKEVFVDGWLRTGDEVLFHENGDFFVIDRIKELIKVKGYQVAPAELEGHLLDHPDVGDAGVIGIPDEYSGELPLAFVVLKPGVASAVLANPGLADDMRKKIFEHVSSNKSRYKWLTGGIEFIEAIPKNPSGKILRRILRERVKSLKRPIATKL